MAAEAICQMIAGDSPFVAAESGLFPTPYFFFFSIFLVVSLLIFSYSGISWIFTQWEVKSGWKAILLSYVLSTAQLTTFIFISRHVSDPDGFPYGRLAGMLCGGLCLVMHVPTQCFIAVNKSDVAPSSPARTTNIISLLISLVLLSLRITKKMPVSYCDIDIVYRLFAYFLCLSYYTFFSVRNFVCMLMILKKLKGMLEMPNKDSYSKTSEFE
ncbi:unnamed protein product [Caenorhabditis sp. 36 PRJEB53466]|nr:unnamed protein product [Caenorhabditis sp. 36 PRJEB53466]